VTPTSPFTPLVSDSLSSSLDFLNCFYSNAQSLNSKLAPLSLLLLSKKHQLLAFTETWLNDKTPDSLLIGNLPYTLVRADRKNRRGGGVCIFLSSFIEFSIVNSTSTDYDVLYLDILSTLSPLRVILVYRPPSLDLEKTRKLCDLLATLSSVNHHIILLGDFNFPKLNWIDPDDDCPCKSSLTFQHFCLDADLTQLVHEPTRENPPSILDLVLTSDPDMVSNLTVQSKFSDHCSIVFQITASQPITPPPPRLLFFKGNFEDFNLYMFSVDWVSLFLSCPDVDSQYSAFLDVLRLGISLFIPTGVNRCPTSEYPQYIQNLIEYKHQLWRDIALPGYRAKYDACSAKLKKLSLKFLRNQEKKILSSPDQNALYRFINSKLTSKSRLPVLIDSKGHYCITDAAKANALAAQFSSVFVNDDGILPPIRLPSLPATFAEVHFFPDQVFLALRALKSRFSLTPDGVPPILLKRLASSAAQPLCHIFNTSMMTSTVPKIWKTSFVVPIPKKGYSKSPVDYRPISITPISVRVMERLIAAPFRLYLNINNLLPPSQHGFRSGYSVTTQLLECLDDWTRALSTGHNVDILYFDFAKAFDTVSHQKLLHKLEHYGFTGPFLAWIKSFLTDRTFSVRVNDTFSAFFPVLSGVPQGSVLGPLLYLLYSLEIPSIIKFCKTSLYADDTKMYEIYLPKNAPLNLMAESALFAQWAKTWQLELAVKKCSVLHLGTNNKKHQFILNGAPVALAPSPIRDLGVLIDKKLSFDDHIYFIYRKAFGRLFALFKAIRSKDLSVHVRAYVSYVRPIIETASPVFNPTCSNFRASNSQIQMLEKIQKHFTRIAFARCLAQDSPDYTNIPSYTERLKIFGLETLELRRLKADLVLTYKILNGKMGNKNKLFSFNQSSTRGDPIKINRESTTKNTPNFRSNFFTLRMARKYHNRLLSHCISAKNAETFRNRLNSLLAKPKVLARISKPYFA
jgi:hypothetical protein